MTGAGCGDWTDAESAQTLRPCTNMDVSKIKGEEGDVNTCKRCVGKVKTVIFERHFLKKNTYPAFYFGIHTFGIHTFGINTFGIHTFGIVHNFGIVHTFSMHNFGILHNFGIVHTFGYILLVHYILLVSTILDIDYLYTILKKMNSKNTNLSVF